MLYQGGLDSIDGRAYDNSNLHRIYTGWETNPAEKTNLRCGYNLLFADDNTSKVDNFGRVKTVAFIEECPKVGARPCSSLLTS